MIRYAIAQTALERQVDATASTWRARAKRRTERFRRAGKYDESAGIWSEVKRVFMALQHDKCAFCERKLADAAYGLVEHDVEHFRPKSNVRAWPDDEARAAGIGYRFSTGPSWPGGYYLLAYCLLNYADSCKPCNTRLKSDFFPVYAARGPQSDDPRPLAVSERPLLIYPIGDLDEDPESIITFAGILPIPRVKRGFRSYRGRVTIDFFRLDRRRDLDAERADRIQWLWIALEGLRTTTAPTERAVFERGIQSLISPASPHTNCARAFHALYLRDPAAARAFYDQAVQILASVGR